MIRIQELKSTDKEVLDLLPNDMIMEGDPGFVDAANGDFRLKEDSPAWKLGFQAIPYDKIGLYVDEFRKTLPAEQ